MIKPKRLPTETLASLRELIDTFPRGYPSETIETARAERNILMSHIAALEVEIADLTSERILLFERGIVAIDDAHDPMETAAEAQLGVQITEMLVELERIGHPIMARQLRKYVRDLEQDCNAGASMLAKLHDRYNTLYSLLW